MYVPFGKGLVNFKKKKEKDKKQASFCVIKLKGAQSEVCQKLSQLNELTYNAVSMEMLWSSGGLLFFLFPTLWRLYIFAEFAFFSFLFFFFSFFVFYHIMFSIISKGIAAPLYSTCAYFLSSIITKK